VKPLGIIQNYFSHPPQHHLTKSLSSTINISPVDVCNYVTMFVTMQHCTKMITSIVVSPVQE